MTEQEQQELELLLQIVELKKQNPELSIEEFEQLIINIINQ